jgi:seryl-tRNA synthetase
VATERTMVAILENYQTSNQSVIVPTVLRKYMGGMKEIKVK